MDSSPRTRGFFFFRRPPTKFLDDPLTPPRSTRVAGSPNRSSGPGHPLQGGLPRRRPPARPPAETFSSRPGAHPDPHPRHPRWPRSRQPHLSAQQRRKRPHRPPVPHL